MEGLIEGNKGRLEADETDRPSMFLPNGLEIYKRPGVLHFIGLGFGFGYFVLLFYLLYNLYIYIYKTETFETPTIFHVSIIFK